MQILIHACPKRLWYVNGFLVPQLLAQGAEEIEIWNDADGLGNLHACMESFRSRRGAGGTWHIQDDVLPCRDFVSRCEKNDDGVVSGFCCDVFGDDPLSSGRVYAASLWHSFQCIRIPDEYARECAEWYFSGDWSESPSAELPILDKLGKGDDTFFHEFMESRHGGDTVKNLVPNLVEHIDWLIGGSVLNEFQSVARAYFWNDEKLVAELRERLRGHVPK